MTTLAPVLADAASNAEGIRLLVAVVLSTLAVSSFCSICEAALYAVSNGRIERLAHAGSVAGRRLQRLRQEIDQPIAAILTLNTIANTVGATVAGWVAASTFDSWGVGMFSAAFTLAILFLSEIIPKTIGVRYADELAPTLSLPIRGIIVALWPLVNACHFVTRLLPRSKDSSSAASEEELLALARLGLRSGALRPDEARWMQNALKLDTIKVSQILTPRTVVFSAAQETAVADLAKIVSTWPHSRVPVAEKGDLDRVTGVVLRRDVYDAIVGGSVEQTLADLMRSPTFVPETMKVSDLLAQFLRQREHLFIVADEYGGMAGVVTLEDTLESLLGTEIVDEFDRVADMQRDARRRASQKLRKMERSPTGRDDTRKNTS